MNIIPGPGRTVGERIVAHDKIDKVAFTGSTGVGKSVMKGAVIRLRMSHLN